MEFEVEQAGCEGCAALVRSALEPLATVERLEIDEAADRASVQLRPTGELTEAAVNEALAAASQGSGHAYRVRPGSWTPA